MELGVVGEPGGRVDAGATAQVLGVRRRLEAAPGQRREHPGRLDDARVERPGLGVREQQETRAANLGD